MKKSPADEAPSGVSSSEQIGAKKALADEVPVTFRRRAVIDVSGRRSSGSCRSDQAEEGAEDVSSADQAGKKEAPVDEAPIDVSAADQASKKEAPASDAPGGGEPSDPADSGDPRRGEPAESVGSAENKPDVPIEGGRVRRTPEVLLVRLLPRPTLDRSSSR